MFIPESLSPCACRRDVLLNGRKASRVALHAVQFTARGMALIGLGMQALAQRHGLPLELIRDRMKNNLYAVPPSESLYFLFQVPELDADMHVEIPPAHWRFTVPGQTAEGLAVPA